MSRDWSYRGSTGDRDRRGGGWRDGDRRPTGGGTEANRKLFVKNVSWRVRLIGSTAVLLCKKMVLWLGRIRI